MIGIYLHIPYCRTICPYCDFVRARTPREVPEAFVAALLAEIGAYDGPHEAHAVFFGGGTPSLLAPQHLEALLDALARRFRLHEPEVTLEANPDDVTPEKARIWRQFGVNRVSLGVQSFDDETLRYLGRRHDAQAALDACAAVGETFDTWNLDLIFGAKPAHTWRTTLARCRELAPPHVAAYGLTYEAGTPFEQRVEDAVDDDAALALYQEAEEALSGYDHYEISNFAKPGHQCRHNLVYWHNQAYAGFGTGAYSFIGNVRARNLAETDAYLKAPGEKCERLPLTEAEIRVETVIQWCRLRDGLEKAAYRDRFGADVFHHFGETLQTLINRGLLEDTPTHLRPTAEGFYLNNEIGLALVSSTEAGAA